MKANDLQGQLKVILSDQVLIQQNKTAKNGQAMLGRYNFTVKNYSSSSSVSEDCPPLATPMYLMPSLPFAALHS